MMLIKNDNYSRFSNRGNTKKYEILNLKNVTYSVYKTPNFYFFF